VTNNEGKLEVALEYCFMEARIEEKIFEGGDEIKKSRK
jgi:hypothetical protein